MAERAQDCWAVLPWKELLLPEPSTVRPGALPRKTAPTSRQVPAVKDGQREKTLQKLLSEPQCPLGTASPTSIPWLLHGEEDGTHRCGWKRRISGILWLAFRAIALTELQPQEVPMVPAPLACPGASLPWGLPSLFCSGPKPGAETHTHGV